MAEKRAQPQQPLPQQQRLTAPLPPLPRRSPSLPQRDYLRDVGGEGCWEFDAEITEGAGALIVRSDSSGTWWFGVAETGDDRGEHVKEDLWKRTGIRTGYIVSVFGEWGKGSGRRRPTRPRREWVREKKTHHLPGSNMFDTSTYYV